MKKSRFSEEQIIGILNEHHAGSKTADLCRRHGISDATILQMAIKIWWHGGFGRKAVEGA